MFYEEMTKEQLIDELRKKDKIIENLRQNSTDSTLKAVLESTADGIIVVDYSGKVIHSNKKFSSLWRIPDDFIDENDMLKLAERVKNELYDPEAFIPEIKRIMSGRVRHMDRLLFKNNRVFERLFNPLIVDNELRGMVWSFTDITSQVMMEKEIMQSQKLYRKLIEFLPVGILVYKDSKVLLANMAASMMLKQSKVDILGRKAGSIAKLHPDFRKESLDKVKKLSEDQVDLGFDETKLILQDGSVIDIETASFSFRNEDEYFVATIMRDISEQKRISQLEKAISEKSNLLKAAKDYNRLKTQLFSTISHELKTPLNIIFGSVQLLENIYSTAPLDKYLKIMKQNCYRLLRLINNLIDMNRIEVGFYTLNLNNYDIVKIIEDITLSVVDYTNSKGIELIFDTNIEEKLVSCDAEKLERVMLNLLSNAIKFTDAGGKIEVNICDKDNSIEISVKDSGYGIPSNMLQEIFETFRQVDSTLRRKAEGSGIGLSLVKSLVEMHGGTIRAKSELGKGSEFIFDIPAKVLADTAAPYKESMNADNKVERVSIEFSDIYS